MYLRAVHVEHDEAELRQLIRDHPLGLLTTAIDVPGHDLLQHTHVPWLLQQAKESDELDDREAAYWLEGHMARANPHVKALLAARAQNGSVPARQVSVIFTHAAQSYITPKNYTTTKPATGKVVPTWNYAAAHVSGTLELDEDPGYLLRQTAALTDTHEAAQSSSDGKPAWTSDDAPQEYIRALCKAIIGVRIRVDSLAGKWKMSQEMPLGDRVGVVEGLRAIGKCDVADVVQERSDLRENAL